MYPKQNTINIDQLLLGLEFRLITYLLKRTDGKVLTNPNADVKNVLIMMSVMKNTTYCTAMYQR